jgi:hypothetical protein
MRKGVSRAIVNVCYEVGPTHWPGTSSHHSAHDVLTLEKKKKNFRISTHFVISNKVYRTVFPTEADSVAIGKLKRCYSFMLLTSSALGLLMSVLLGVM